MCIYEIVRVLYGKTIDVVLTAENQSYVRIKKRTYCKCTLFLHHKKHLRCNIVFYYLYNLYFYISIEIFYLK